VAGFDGRVVTVAGDGAELFSKRDPLRVAVLVDGSELPHWAAQIIRDIKESDIAEVVLVVQRSAETQPTVSPFRKPRSRPDILLYGAYQSLDQFLFSVRKESGTAFVHPRREPSRPDPFVGVDIGDLVAGASHLTIRPIQTRFCDYWSDSDIGTVVSHKLDVALCFGCCTLRGGALDIARHGVWSYHHGDSTRYHGGPAGFWEIFEHDPVIGAELQVLNADRDNGPVLQRSFSSTDKYSVSRNRVSCHSTSSKLVIQALRQLYSGNASPLSIEVTDGVPKSNLLAHDSSPCSSSLSIQPRSAEMAVLLLRHGMRVAQERLSHAMFSERWVLAYRSQSTIPSSFGFTYLLPPKDRIWADPFPLLRDGRHYVFFEEQAFSSGRAHISVMEMDSTGRFSEPTVALSRPYHLSYPCIFEWEGGVWMVPESAEAGRVELYRCTEFPHRWDLESILLDDVRAVDSTLTQIEGEWWMFVNIVPKETDDYSDLHLFTAETLAGPWRPHLLNPVKSNIRSTRSGGRSFWWAGHLYRPAQDCARRYGHAVSIQDVRRPDRHTFEEKEVGRIEPTWDPRVVAAHTFNMVPGLSMIDALVRRPRLDRCGAGRGLRSPDGCMLDQLQSRSPEIRT